MNWRAPVRGLYEELRKLCLQRAEEMKCQPEAVLLSRREIREATGWSDWQVRSYCRQLVEMEYLYATINGNGRPCVYSLARAEENDRAGLRGGCRFFDNLHSCAGVRGQSLPVLNFEGTGH